MKPCADTLNVYTCTFISDQLFCLLQQNVPYFIVPLQCQVTTMHRTTSTGKEFHQKKKKEISKNAANRCMNPCVWYIVYSFYVCCVVLFFYACLPHLLCYSGRHRWVYYVRKDYDASQIPPEW